MELKTELVGKTMENLNPSRSKGKFQGMENLMSTEMSRWKHSIAWWLQIGIMLGMMNGIMELAIIGSGEGPEFGLMIFFIFLGVYPPMSLATSIQSAIVKEKNDGTAAWVLSKPATRLAFITSKYLTNTISMCLTMVVAPMAVAYIQFLARGIVPNLVGTLAVVGMMTIWNFFWLSMGIMLGTVMKSHKAVMGTMLAIYFIFVGSGSSMPMILNPAVFYPESSSVPGSSLSICADFFLGIQPIMNFSMIWLVGASVLFVAISIRRFLKQEL
ncbi:MAG: ABC transporter permease [Candidatus Hodarchaeota archaeon]